MENKLVDFGSVHPDVKRYLEQGYGLDILIHDNDDVIRQTVAEQGYGLDILVHDKSPLVRLAVAKQGYELDILVNDENWAVCDEVERQLRKFS